MTTLKKFELKTIQTNFPALRITGSKDAAEVIRNFYSDDIEIFESFFILTLNQGNLTTGYAKISQGGVAGTVVDAKLIAKYAIENLACGIILAHNHPGGSLQPSAADRQLTTKIQSGLKLLDVKVLDHIILTSASYYSFTDQGLL